MYNGLFTKFFAEQFVRVFAVEVEVCQVRNLFTFIEFHQVVVTNNTRFEKVWYLFVVGYVKRTLAAVVCKNKVTLLVVDYGSRGERIQNKFNGSV